MANGMTIPKSVKLAAMKALYLMRHAKSSWSEPGLGDQQRPLNSRGLRDAPMMGQRFRDRDERVDRIVASPAQRARQTAQLFGENCGFDTDSIEIDEGLYFLGSGAIEAAIHRQPESPEALMLVFHNPDITYFVNAIDYDFRIDNMPTSGLVRFRCDIERWSDWSVDSSAFDYVDYPKNDSGDVLRAR